MSDPLGPAASLILRHCMIPEPVITALTRSQFAEELSLNAWLTADQRISWLAERPPTLIARNLCGHGFTAADIDGVLAVESRKSVLAELAVANQGHSDVIEGLLEAAGAKVAGSLVGSRSVGPATLLAHFDHMTRFEQLRCLAECDRSVPDTTVAALFAAVDQSSPASHRRQIGELVDWIVTFRPGVVAAFDTAGEVPPLARLAVARSPWAGDIDIDALCRDTASPYELKEILEELARNPWITDSGSAATRISQFGTPRAQRLLATRMNTRSCIAGRPAELHGAQLSLLCTYAADLSRRPGQAHALHLLACPNPGLGDLAPTLSHLLRRSDLAVAAGPRWAYEEALAAFASNYPGLIGEWAEKRLAGKPDRYVTGLVGPENPRYTANRYHHTRIGPAIAMTAMRRNAVLAMFADALGDDADAWVAALLLADNVDVSFSALADLASVTADTAA